jgi:hypothetical protein
MRQVWHSHGVVVGAPVPTRWAHSHAALPVVFARGSDLALFCSSRDDRGRSHIASGQLDLEAGAASFDEKPAVTIGDLGAFDDSGVTSSCVVSHDGRVLQYYTGWSLGVTVPFVLGIGCAESEDGGRTFRKVSRAPVLGRTAIDPYLTASPSVLVEGDTWRMWYVSGSDWRATNDGVKHRYHVRYAESTDGVHWEPTGRVCVDYRDEHETAIARPCVVRDTDAYRMWFCSRGDAYRIGYAESSDGLTWTRCGDAIEISGRADAWDSEMQAYPFIVDHDGTRHMLYNGNGYGATGIGHAVLQRCATT